MDDKTSISFSQAMEYVIKSKPEIVENTVALKGALRDIASDVHQCDVLVDRATDAGLVQLMRCADDYGVLYNRCMRNLKEKALVNDDVATQIILAYRFLCKDGGKTLYNIIVGNDSGTNAVKNSVKENVVYTGKTTKRYTVSNDARYLAIRRLTDSKDYDKPCRVMFHGIDYYYYDFLYTLISANVTLPEEETDEELVDFKQRLFQEVKEMFEFVGTTERFDFNSILDKAMEMGYTYSASEQNRIKYLLKKDGYYYSIQDIDMRYSPVMDDEPAVISSMNNFVEVKDYLLENAFLVSTKIGLVIIKPYSGSCDGSEAVVLDIKGGSVAADRITVKIGQGGKILYPGKQEQVADNLSVIGNPKRYKALKRLLNCEDKIHTVGGPYRVKFKDRDYYLISSGGGVSSYIMTSEWLDTLSESKKIGKLFESLEPLFDYDREKEFIDINGILDVAVNMGYKYTDDYYEHKKYLWKNGEHYYSICELDSAYSVINDGNVATVQHLYGCKKAIDNYEDNYLMLKNNIGIVLVDAYRNIMMDLDGNYTDDGKQSYVFEIVNGEVKVNEEFVNLDIDGNVCICDKNQVVENDDSDEDDYASRCDNSKNVGFRTGVWWKKVIASIYYAIMLIVIIKTFMESGFWSGILCWFKMYAPVYAIGESTKECGTDNLLKTFLSFLGYCVAYCIGLAIVVAIIHHFVK